MRANKWRRLCGNTLDSGTFAALHSFFISAHTLLLSSGLPFRVTKILPLFILFSAVYSSSTLHKSRGRITRLFFPLQRTSAHSRLIASTVINRNSEIRMPVAHIVCKM